MSLIAKSSARKRVLRHFMNKCVVALSVHDSYVVPESYFDELREVMKQAWEKVLGLIPSDPEMALDAFYTPYTKTKQIGYTDERLGEDDVTHKCFLQSKAEQDESHRYRQSLRLFLEWKEGKDKYPQ